MQDILNTDAAHHGIEVVQSDSHAAVLVGRRVRSRRRWLVVVASLVLSDVLLAFAIWQATFVLRDALGLGPLSVATVAVIIKNTIAWVGLRAALGLYPAY